MHLYLVRGREDYLIRLCMVVDWCLDQPKYTTKIKVVPKKDCPVRPPTILGRFLASMPPEKYLFFIPSI